MTLTELDLRILQLIELKPTISVREIAEKANTSWITANKHIESLKKSGVLSNPVAVFNPSRLGLVRVIVLFKAHTKNQLNGIEVACDVHPYTHYRSRIYGPFTGIMAQFDIPTKGLDKLYQFLDKLKEIGVCDDVFYHLSNGYRTSTTTNLEFFDPQSMSWNYDWATWRKVIISASTILPVQKERPPETLDFGPADLIILRELTSNATIPQSALQKKLGLSQSTVSRKVINIMSNYIESIRAQIDRSQFDVTSTKLFYSRNPDEGRRNQLFNAFLEDFAPPFPLSIDLLSDSGVVLWGRMPPSHEHNLFYTLWENLPNLQVFTMDTVRKHSCLYWFYPDNFDTEFKTWRSGVEWLVDNPLEELDETLKR